LSGFHASKTDAYNKSLCGSQLSDFCSKLSAFELAAVVFSFLIARRFLIFPDSKIRRGFGTIYFLNQSRNNSGALSFMGVAQNFFSAASSSFCAAICASLSFILG